MKESARFEKPATAALISTEQNADSTSKQLLIQRRKAHLGGSALFYREPIQIVRGEGVWLFDELGRKYLDCYNNVACVGHCHPKVVKALCAQAQILNTHTRYLHEEVVKYAERLANSFPDTLEVCFLVCSGTEANELAMRIARSITGHQGAIVMEGAYHGNSILINEMSTCLSTPDQRPPHIAAVEPPNTYRGPFGPGENAGQQYAGLVDAAINQLQGNGQGVAAFMCDMIFDSQGTLEAPEDYFRHVYHSVRAAGGLCIADEVQSGLFRTGTQWGFEHYGVVPDIITLGKPMGAGHPLAAVITTREIAEKFARTNAYFNTFGGNPVSAAVGNAVLDVLADEHVQDNVLTTGAYMREGLINLAKRHPAIGDIRGRGLFLGIELVTDRISKSPDSPKAVRIAEQMRGEGILIGVSGRHGNVIKFRPPLTFSRENANFLLMVLDKLLAANAPGIPES
jgi:4-aminobutyrate aminotransferase-like enzyme